MGAGSAGGRGQGGRKEGGKGDSVARKAEKDGLREARRGGHYLHGQLEERRGGDTGTTMWRWDRSTEEPTRPVAEVTAGDPCLTKATGKDFFRHKKHRP